VVSLQFAGGGLADALGPGLGTALGSGLALGAAGGRLDSALAIDAVVTAPVSPLSSALLLDDDEPPPNKSVTLLKKPPMPLPELELELEPELADALAGLPDSAGGGGRASCCPVVTGPESVIAVVQPVEICGAPAVVEGACGAAAGALAVRGGSGTWAIPASR
jgi:hypothetical protein